MSAPNKNASLPELREIVKENDRKVFSFISYLVFDAEAAEAAALATFGDFGKFYRRIAASRRAQYDAPRLRIRLFQYAWKNAQMHAAVPAPLHTGRDTRVLNEASMDLLARITDEPLDERALERVTDRIRTLDLDFRASLVLRDVLKFEDDEVTRMLGIRWGVYRHRLNRARLDLIDCFRGRTTAVANLRVPSELSV